MPAFEYQALDNAGRTKKGVLQGDTPKAVRQSLRDQGLVRDPTPEELRLAAVWDNLPKEEKQAVLWELDHLPPGPMASDIIIENRR